MRALFEDLDLRGATVVVHDWGGPVGLRLAVELPERIDRLVLMDTGLFTGRQRMTDAWHQFRDFVERTEDLPVVDARPPRLPDATPATRWRPPTTRRSPSRAQGRRAGVPADAARSRPRIRAPRPASACSRRWARTAGRR